MAFVCVAWLAKKICSIKFATVVVLLFGASWFYSSFYEAQLEMKELNDEEANEDFQGNLTLNDDTESSVDVMFNTTVLYNVHQKPLSNAYDEHSLKIIFKDLYKPGFRTALSSLCSNNGTSTKVVILIPSAPSNFKKRMTIRNTDKYYKLGREIGVPISFVIGIVLNETISELVKNESEMYHDIILNNNVDTYDNLPLKVMSMYEWFQAYCCKASYLMKADDDREIYVRNLLKFIQKRPVQSKVIYGHKMLNIDPNRSVVPIKVYKKKTLPDFVNGPAYLMSSDVPGMLCPEAMGRVFMKPEDVFFTGVVAERVGVRRVDHYGFIDADTVFKQVFNTDGIVSDYLDEKFRKEQYKRMKLMANYSMAIRLVRNIQKAMNKHS